MKKEIKNSVSIFHSLWPLVFLFFIIAAAASCGGGGGGGDGDGDGGGGSGGPITVSGKVVDNTGAPVSAASVVLNNNFAALQTTPAGGTFSFSNVTPPYTLTVRSGTAIREYRNLSRSNPQISVSGGVIYGATLGGNVTGPTYPLPAGNRIIIGATNGVLPMSVSASTATGAYNGAFAWLGNTNTTTDLVALRYTYISPDITGYSQMGKRSGVNLSNGVNQSGLDIALSNPVSTASTTFNYNLGAYTVFGGGVLLTIKADGALFYLPLPVTSGSSMLLPNEGGTFLVSGSDASGNGAIRIAPAVLGGTTTLDLPSSTALQNSLPANGAINVSKTPTLNWTPVAGAELYVISLSGPGLNYSIIIPGTSNNLTIPDYTTLGLPLSGSTAYSWSVIGVKDWGGSSDTITDPAGMGGGFNFTSLYMVSSLTYYGSVGTTFTTVP